jgi:hypothetical protein
MKTKIRNGLVVYLEASKPNKKIINKNSVIPILIKYIIFNPWSG